MRLSTSRHSWHSSLLHLKNKLYGLLSFVIRHITISQYLYTWHPSHDILWHDMPYDINVCHKILQSCQQFLLNLHLTSMSYVSSQHLTKISCLMYISTSNIWHPLSYVFKTLATMPIIFFCQHLAIVVHLTSDMYTYQG